MPRGLATRRALVLCVPILAACSSERPGEPVGTAQQADTCATGATLEGVDVSVYDGTVDWAQLEASGRAFAIAKATEGASFSDSQFPTNWPAMKSAGIVRSAYHFFHCDADPAAQATFFLGVMGALEPGDLPPSLDFEDTTTCAPSTGIAMAIEWLDAVASATGTLPILYTSVNVLSQFQNTQSLAGHAQLWVASRGVTCPDLPAPFAAWSFWQYSLTGTAPGLPNSNGMADLDQFNGDMSALLGLTVGGSADASSGAGSDSGEGDVSTGGSDASSGGGGDGAGDAGETSGEDGGAGAPADPGPKASSASCSCSTAPGSSTTWTSILPAALLLGAGSVAASCRRRRRNR
jgi:lysozyme